MQLRPRHITLLATAAFSAAFAAVPTGAMASHQEEGFDATATIAACRSESLTIAAQIEPSGDVPRKLRRASLRLRFEAAPLFGRTRKSREFDLGRTMNTRRSVRFADLSAQAYGGIVRYRWVRGSRTVASGFVRTRRARVAGKRGRASCSIRVGRPPRDTQPPSITPIPNDSAWHRGPLRVAFFVFDDLSGVALVVSRVDGGPFVRGRSTTISGEGAHRLEYVARDAAGNQTAPAAVTLRVDENPPTQPVITTPSGSTSDSTPEIRWNASSDSASGVAGYVVLVRDSGGAIVWSQNVAANVTAATVGQVLGTGSYSAEVVAYDGTYPRPFTATGTSAFTVAPPTSEPPPPPPPDGDGDGIVDASDNCPTVANPDQSDINNDGQGNHCDNSDGDGLTDHQELTSQPPNDTLWNDPDSDDDGVNDGPDQCPNDAGSALFPVGPDGCPP